VNELCFRPSPRGQEGRGDRRALRAQDRSAACTDEALKFLLGSDERFHGKAASVASPETSAAPPTAPAAEWTWTGATRSGCWTTQISRRCGRRVARRGDFAVRSTRTCPCRGVDSGLSTCAIYQFRSISFKPPRFQRPGSLSPGRRDTVAVRRSVASHAIRRHFSAEEWVRLEKLASSAFGQAGAGGERALRAMS
jgi:hypothetical protein